MSSVEIGQMSAVETGQMTAAETSVLSQHNAPGCSWLLQADPDHEIPDFDQFLLEKLKVFAKVHLFLQLYEEFLKVTSIMTAFLQGILVVMTSRRILPPPTAPTLDRQNPSAKAVWGKLSEMD